MERIKRVRKTAGLTLAEVGKRAGLLPEAVARAERAGIDPRASTVAAIAKALRVPVCELFEERGHGRFKETGHERQRRQRLSKP